MYHHQTQIALTLCNLLSQDYPYWRLVIVAPDSLYHPLTARSILEIDKWNEIAKEYFSNVRFSLLSNSNWGDIYAANRHRLELLCCCASLTTCKIDGSEWLDAALQVALEYSTSKWILFWSNQNRWSVTTRLKTQVRSALYFDQHAALASAETISSNSISEKISAQVKELLASATKVQQLDGLYHQNWLCNLLLQTRQNHSSKSLLSLLKEIESDRSCASQRSH